MIAEKESKNIFNIKKSENKRIFGAWSMMFLSRLGFIIGWSTMIAIFLEKIGIEKLPILFLANAITIVFGTLSYQLLVPKKNRELVMVFSILLAVALLISSLFCINSNENLFFILILIGSGIFITQMNILLSLHNEALFTPLESQRTFPIIESAETIGGILGGLVLSLFAHNVSSYKFILIWAIAIMAILPFILSFQPQKNSGELTSKDKKFNLPENIKFAKKTPFLRSMMLIVLLNWTMMNIIEFQYTKAIQQEVYEISEKTIAIEENTEGSPVILSEIQEKSESYYKEEITKKLGFFHIIFNAAALLVQCILGGRILTSLGIVRGMLIHPSINFFSVMIMTLKFNLNGAVFARGVYELSGFILKSASDSAHYAIPNAQRAAMKEIMQGILKPGGAVLGTSIVAILAFLFNGTNESLSMNLTLLILSALMYLSIKKMRNSYTQMSEQNLSRKKDAETRMNAVEILAQNGHSHHPSSLLKILKRQNESKEMRIEVLNTLGENAQISSIEGILACLSDKEEEIRSAALQALKKYQKIKKYPFTYQRVLSTIKELLHKEKNNDLKSDLIAYFFSIAANECTQYLLNEMQSKNTKNKVEVIKMLKIFQDPNLWHFLEPYLKDPSFEVRGACISALWQFKEKRMELNHLLKQMMESPKKEVALIGNKTLASLKEKFI